MALLLFTIGLIRQAKNAAPRVPVIARSRYHSHAQKLIEAGANGVVDEEELVGSTFGAEVLEALRES